MTDFYTGVSGITPLSPALSWSAGSDRLAFVYFEQGKYDVYSVSSPRQLKKEPYQRRAAPALIAGPLGAGPARPVVTARAAPPTRGTGLDAPKPPAVLSGVSLYRGPDGFRPTDSLETVADSVRGPEPVSVARILDSTGFALPDTAEFIQRSYRIKFQPEYVSQPTLGYARDNFGNSVYGSATVVLGDMLGNHKLIFGATLNGRIEEANLLAQYADLSRRFLWTVGINQAPYYGYGAAGSIPPPDPGSFEATYVTQYQRYVYRTLFGSIQYPVSRFRRVELGMSTVNVDYDLIVYSTPYDIRTGVQTQATVRTTESVDNSTYVMPSLALVFDNVLGGWIGPLLGRRSRIEVAQSLGSWEFFQGTFDYRRYDKGPGPFVLASRLMYFGRRGRDAEIFQVFGGTTELIRGHTYGSYERNECSQPSSQLTACAVNNLIGSQVAVGNFELRYPLPNGLMRSLPVPLPGFEFAVFFDIGMVWDNASIVKWKRDPGDPYLPTHDVPGLEPTDEIRTPVRSWGFAARWNLLGALPMRLDYAIPFNRPGTTHLWTLSLGPTF